MAPSSGPSAMRSVDADAVGASPSSSSSSSTSSNQPPQHEPGAAESSSQPYTYFQVSSLEEAEESMIEVAIAVVDQPLRMLRSGALQDRHLQYQSKLIPGSSPGKHLRHVHDHLRILTDSLHAALGSARRQSESEPGAAGVISIDYDARHSVPSLESSARACERAFARIQDSLRGLLAYEHERGRLFNREVELCATTPITQRMRTTVGREIWFASLHSIHHYALARVTLVNELDVPVDPDFGFAPSTITRRQQRLEHAAKERRARL